MSFDLHFCPRDSPAPGIAELKQYFEASAHFHVEDVALGGVQFWYQNEATGVYCDFSYSLLDAKEFEGCGSSGLTFNLNYLRPSFFSYETMPVVEAFCKRFNLVVEDPQEDTLQAADASRLIASWRAHNAKAIGAVSTGANENDIELHYLPEERATDWWRYMSLKQEIETTVTQDVFVPSIMILIGPAQQPFTMTVWPKGITQFFPPCDYVYVQREKKRFFGTKEEAGLVDYDAMIATIEPLLDYYELRNLRIKYLSPQQTHGVARLVQSLDLEPVDLSGLAPLASDGFHDVASTTRTS